MESQIPMEKYGVQTTQDEDKTATEQRICPVCGRELIASSQTGVKKCPSCGTEPFESQ